jgi:hypothetical protein
MYRILSWFSGVRVTRSLVLSVGFVDRCLSFFNEIKIIVANVIGQYRDRYTSVGTVVLTSTLIICPRLRLGHYQCFSQYYCPCAVYKKSLKIRFVDRCLSFCIFSFGHCVVCSSSIDGFWLHLWYRLFFFDWWILITPLVSSNSSYRLHRDNSIDWNIDNARAAVYVCCRR